MTTTQRGYLDAFLVILIWAGFALVSRMAGKSPLLFYDMVALRFGTAALLLAPLAIKYRIPILNPKIMVLACTGGIIFALCAYYGFTQAPAAHGAILIPGMLPFTSAIFSWLLLRHPPSRQRCIGLALIGAGALCLLADTSGTQSAWRGDASFLAASCWLALYSVLSKKWELPARDSAFGSALVAGFIYIPVYLLALPKAIAVTPLATIALQAFYQGFLVVIVAMVLYMRAVNELGPARIGMWMALVPVMAALGAIPLLHEPLTAFVALGLALTCAGAWIGNRG